MIENMGSLEVWGLRFKVWEIRIEDLKDFSS